MSSPTWRDGLALLSIAQASALLVATTRTRLQPRSAVAKASLGGASAWG